VIRAGSMVHMAEHLPSKYETLSLNLSIKKKKVAKKKGDKNPKNI
jgi:hypothetical protein